MTNLYIQISVWKRLNEETLVKFNCLKDVATEKYNVQSSDFFYRPFNKKSLQQSNTQFLELLIELPPRDRATCFATLEEAVAMHEKEFED